MLCGHASYLYVNFFIAEIREDITNVYENRNSQIIGAIVCMLINWRHWRVGSKIAVTFFFLSDTFKPLNTRVHAASKIVTYC